MSAPITPSGTAVEMVSPLAPAAAVAQAARGRSGSIMLLSTPLFRASPVMGAKRGKPERSSSIQVSRGRNLSIMAPSPPEISKAEVVPVSRSLFYEPPETDSVEDGEEFELAENLSRFTAESPSKKQVRIKVEPEKEKEQAKSDTKEYNFTDVVDIDEDEAYEYYISDELLGKLLDSAQFRTFILLVIAINSVLIGLQTDRQIEEDFTGILGLTDSIILTIFVVEILLKWYHGFWLFWAVGWNIFDFFIVFISLVGPSVSFLSSSRVLRLLRILRAFRTLRSISALQGLQLIVQTLLNSLPDVANIVLLLVILMFVFSVVGVSLFSQVLPEHFGNMGSNMFTLFILMTQDGWAQIFELLREKGQMVGAAIYFMLFIIVGAFVFINVIVGVNVTNLQNSYTEIKRRRRQRHRKLGQSSRRNQDNQLESSRQVAEITEAGPEVWRNQIPTEAPSLDRPDLGDVERYFLTLSAIEDNLVEHSNLRAKMEAISKEIKLLNKSLRGAEGSSASDMYEEEEQEAPAGDYLSQLMRRGSERQAAQEEARFIQTIQKRRAMFGELQEEQARNERARRWAAGQSDKRVSFGRPGDGYTATSPRGGAKPSLSPKGGEQSRIQTLFTKMRRPSASEDIQKVQPPIITRPTAVTSLEENTTSIAVPPVTPRSAPGMHRQPSFTLSQKMQSVDDLTLAEDEVTRQARIEERRKMYKKSPSFTISEAAGSLFNAMRRVSSSSKDMVIPVSPRGAVSNDSLLGVPARRQRSASLDYSAVAGSARGDQRLGIAQGIETLAMGLGQLRGPPSPRTVEKEEKEKVEQGDKRALKSGSSIPILKLPSKPSPEDSPG